MPFDPFADGSSTELKDKPDGFDPFANGSSTAAPDQPLGPNANWDKLYGGLDGMDDRLDPHQKLALASLDKTTDNPKESRAQAVNQAYLQTKMKGMDPAIMQRNWGAVKDVYAKQQFGFVGKDISDSALYGQISQRMQEQAKDYAENHAVLREPTSWEKVENIKPWTFDHTIGEDLYKTKQGLTKFWQSINKPFAEIPKAPQLPNFPAMGIGNPALVGGVYNALAPLAEGVETPLGVATLALGPELAAASKAYPLAKAALATIGGVFTGLMAHSTVAASKQAQIVLKDPQASLQDKVAALTSPVAQAGATLLGAFGTALEVMPEATRTAFLEKIKGKNPAEASDALREEAKAADTPAHAEIFHEAAQKLDEIAPGKTPGDEKTKPLAPAVYQGNTIFPGTATRPEIRYEEFKLTEAVGNSPANGNVSRKTLEAAGFHVPETPVVEEGVQHNIDLSQLDQRSGQPAFHYPKPAPLEEAPAAPQKEALTPAAELPLAKETKLLSEWEAQNGQPVKATAEGEPLGIKNADMDAQMKQMGLPEATPGEKVAWEKDNQEATAKIQADPQAGAKLVAELAKSPRPTTSGETALLTQEMNRLRIERDDAEATLIEAQKSGQVEAVAAARQEIARSRDNFQKAADVFKKVGTLQGQALAARQMMLNEDYSLAAVERRFQVANDGKPLTEEQSAQVKTLSEQLKAAQERIAKYEEQQKAPEAPRTAPRRPKPPSKVTEFLSRQADEARARIKARTGQLNSGIDPTHLSDLAIIGADYLAKGVTKFTDWSTAMVNELGEQIKPYLADVFKQAIDARDNASVAQALQEKKARLETQIARYKEKIESGDISAFPVKAGRPQVKEIEGLAQERDALREELTTMREKAAKVADLEKAIAEKEAKIKEGDLGPKGVEMSRPQEQDIEQLKQKRDALNEKIEALRKEDRADGAELRHQEAQAKALQKAIDEKASQLKSGDLTPKSGKVNRPSPEAIERLKQERDALNEKLAKARQEAARPSDEELLARKVGQIEKTIEARQAQLDSGDIDPKAAALNRPAPPEIEQAKQRLEEINQQIKELREGPTLSPEEKQLQSYKDRTQKGIERMKGQLATGDFSKPVRKAVELDPEALRLKADYERVKRKVQLEEQKIADKNRSAPAKAAELAKKINRAGVLSRVGIIAKLSAIIAERSVMTPVRQMIGYGVGKLLPGLAEQGRFEDVPSFGGMVRSESKALTAMITKGIPGAWDILRMKDTDLQALFEKEHLPDGALSYPSHIHSALHYPVQVADYTRRLQLINERDIRAGIDMTEPVNQLRNMQEAWEYSKRSVFLQKNKIVDGYQQMLRSWESKDKTTGKANPVSQLASFALQVENPVLKIPVNFAEELGEHVFGLMDPPVRLAFQGLGGFRGLSYGEADMILRHVKNGALGSALVLYGFFKYKQVGGFYEEGEKRKKSDVAPGAARIGNTEIPALLLKDTSMEALMAGSTLRRTLESVYRLSDPTKKGIPAGFLAVASGLARDVPFVQESTFVGKLLDPRQREHALAADIASKFVPGFFQEMASEMDKKHPYNPFEQPSPRKVTAPDFGGALKQSVEKGVPFLRQTLPKRDTSTSFRQ